MSGELCGGGESGGDLTTQGRGRMRGEGGNRKWGFDRTALDVHICSIISSSTVFRLKKMEDGYCDGIIIS